MEKYLNIEGPLRTVEVFTMPIVSRKYRKEKKNLKKIRKQGAKYIYKDESVMFDFFMLSDYVRDDLLVQELQSYNRYHNNCYKNLSVANIFNGSSIMIGFVVVGNDTFLHSWVELDTNRGTQVIDYTKNVIMDRDLYYSFMKVEPILQFSSDNYSKYFEVFKQSEELDKTVCFPINGDRVDSIRNQLIISRNK